MRVLISSIAAPGHTYPLLPFAVAGGARPAAGLPPAGHGVRRGQRPAHRDRRPRRLPARVLVAAGPMIDAALVDDLPDTVRVEQWVPQADVVPHAALVVHHGGSGTTLGALASGVPQLLLPQGADQFDNAGAVLAVGAGRRLLPGEATPDAVAEVASALLTDPEPRSAAGAVAREIAAMPSPSEIVAALLV